MIDWKSKLTSRKFWMAVIGLISGVLLAFKVDAHTVETISGVVLSAGSVIAYIIGEGLIDAAGAANSPMPQAPNDTIENHADEDAGK